jgi:hypothetical protein
MNQYRYLKLYLKKVINPLNKIQKELNSISEEQSRQNEDIRNLMVAHMTLVQVLKEASEVEQINKVYNYNNVKGEA